MDGELTLVYKLNKEQKENDIKELKLFGEKFVENNKNKCNLIFIDNEEGEEILCDLTSIFDYK